MDLMAAPGRPPRPGSGRWRLVAAGLLLAAVVLFAAVVRVELVPVTRVRALPSAAPAASPWLPPAVTPGRRAQLANVTTPPASRMPELVTAAERPPSPRLQYNRDVRPILSENCFYCHGNDKNHREADLRLDLREEALKRKVIVPGEPDKSELIARIFAKEEDERMPPLASHKSLSAAQQAILRRWVAEGAEYQPHWAFIPPVKAPLPEVSQPGWPRNPLDRFVLARLDRHDLRPNGEAPRDVLLRRISYDLTGLPPTPEELDAYLADAAPDAYERAVDRLLASPRYGERMATPWLDAVRYADTHGMHFDNERSIWPYRDWVVRAFNQNLPYDQFLTWQLAGDLLPGATREQLIATGYDRCSPSSNEGGSIDTELLFRYCVDRTNTTANVFLGMTAGCAQCHDHKFDPLTNKEYYQLYAFFNNAADPAFDGNIQRTPPVMKLPTAEQTAELAQVERKLAATRTALTGEVQKVAYTDPATLTPPPPVQTVENVWFDDVFPPGPGATPRADGHPLLLVDALQGPVKSGKKSLKRSGDGVIQDFYEGLTNRLQVRPQGKIFAHVYLDPKNPPKAVMLQFHTDNWSHRMIWGEYGAIPFGADNTVQKLHGGPLPKTGEWVRLEINVKDFNLKPGTGFDGMAFTEAGGTTYWDYAGITFDASPAADPELSQQAWERTMAAAEAAKELPAPVRDALAKKSAERKPEQLSTIREYYLREVHSPTRKALAPLVNQLAELDAHQKKIDAETAATLIMAEMPQRRQAHIMLRGQYDKPGDPVDPGTPSFLPPLKKAAAVASRLDLATWFASPDHPLTARVFVNRLWQEFFGYGLVKTPGDFGAQGEPPVNPELLDWLAVEFRESGWDIKHMVRLMLTSATYRQEAKAAPALLERDPENRLLARGPRFRLTAEQIRDTALYVSGLLDPTMGGRGVHPYQPPNIWEPLAFPGSDTQFYKQDMGNALYRRSLYTFWKRTAPPPEPSALDAPSREDGCLRRERSNTPLAALALMNDVQHVEAARALAQRLLLSIAKSVDDRLALGFRMVTARRASEAEMAVLRRSLSRHSEVYRAAPEKARQLIAFGDSKADAKLEPQELAAWTMVCNLLLNLDETLNKN